MQFSNAMNVCSTHAIPLINILPKRMEIWITYWGIVRWIPKINFHKATEKLSIRIIGLNNGGK